MKRNAIVISVLTVIAAMAFVGVASSLNASSNAGRGPAPEDIAEASRLAPGTNMRAHPASRVEGETWTLRSYVNVRGDVCLTYEDPREGVATGCISPDKLFDDGPLFALRGAAQRSVPYAKTEWDRQFAYGIAHPSVTSLTLVNMDCSTHDIALDEHGAFNHVVGSETIKKGELPYKLIARGTEGAVLAEEVVAVGLSRNARKAGLKAPAPKQACR